MWEKIVGWLRFLWDAGQQAQDNAHDIRQLRESDHRLLQVVQALSVENDRLRDELRHERELRERDEKIRQSELRELRTELRLQISEELRRLPPRNS